jgi:anthranilate 1,2-dioxygenase small subunit
MTVERDRIFDLLAQYGALIDAARYEEWLGLFASECRYQVMPRENWQHGLPAALMFCDSRAMLEDRVLALREANKDNIHIDRHLIGLPRMTDTKGSLVAVEASFCSVPDRRRG